MKRLFGTDGMRGAAGQFPLDAATVTAAGRSLVRHLQPGRPGRPQIVTGRDTRESGAWIERAFIEGVLSAGGRAASAGVITTPGVAFLARSMPADAGVVISASHNPFHDNGIKIFAPDGRKLDDATERLIEADIYAERSASAPPADFDESAAPRGGDDLAGYERSESALRASYLDHLAEEAAAGLRLEGLKVVVDCANGAASELAPALLRRLGAHVVSTFDAPDGRNINLDCGSLHTEHLCRRVVEERADLGVAYDGDATLWVLARRMRERGELDGGRVVATVMSNIGLEIALRTLGVELLRADVGDKYVLEELLRTGSSLGGEQSGHIIFPRLSLAGDGMLTTVNLLRAVVESGRPLDELTEGFTRYPQVLVNVRVREKVPFEEVAEVADAAREVRERLGDSGRLLLRYSGTEPLARVMIEGRSQGEIEALAEGLAGVIRGRLGEG